MHWLGKDFLLQAVLPDGARVTLLKVDHWDFNWQNTYDFTTPVALPRGSRIEMVAHFDNFGNGTAEAAMSLQVCDRMRSDRSD